MQILSARLERIPDDDLDCTDDRLNIDEAAKSLERKDEERFRSEQEQVRNRVTARKEFVRTYRVARERARQEASKSDGKAKARTRSAAAANRPTNLPDRMEMMPQGEAKAYMPEGSYLWKSMADSAWHSKVGQFPTCNKSVARHGNQALKMVVSDAWRKHCLLHGVPEGSCPMASLLDLEGPTVAGSSA